MSQAALPNQSQAQGRSASIDDLALLRVFTSALRPVASLKLTMVLFILSIFLILAGTFAQNEAGMWEAIDKYFHAFLVWIDPAIFFPRSWFPGVRQAYPKMISFPFPGGATLGLALMANLTAAHMVRFKMAARGWKLTAGLITLIAGIAVSAAVVMIAQQQPLQTTQASLSWSNIANVILLAGTALSLGLLAYGGVTLSQKTEEGKSKPWMIALVSISSGVLCALGCWALYAFRNDVGAVRILWQLVQAEVAAVVLLAACRMLFAQRAGIVLLHGGVAIIMFGQLFVSLFAVERQIQITEGETASFAHDIRSAELAIIERGDDKEHQTVVPEAILLNHAPAKEGIDLEATEPKSRQLISYEKLPFDIEVLQFFANAKLEDVDPKNAEIKNPADRGIGKELYAEKARKGAGADSNSAVDTPAVYVRMWDRSTKKPLGTYLASLAVGMQDIFDGLTINGKRYDLTLRFERRYTPYRITLEDVRKDDYPGTNTPKNYSSSIRLKDTEESASRPVSISMNHPLRYAGETFYQSGYALDPQSRKEITTLVVVTNLGWMMPYLGCMVVVTGMLYQFTLTLMKFVNAESNAVRQKELELAAAASPLLEARNQPWYSWLQPNWPAVVGVIFCLLVMAAGLRSKKVGPKEFDFEAFGRLPVMSEGRVKPIDSLARETLLVVSGKSTYKPFLELTPEDEGYDRSKPRPPSLPAIRWLLESIARGEAAESFPVIRIENLEVLDLFKLKARPGNMRYSLAEIRASAKEYDVQMDAIRKKETAELSIFEKEMVELDRRLQAHMRVVEAFRARELPPFPAKELIQKRDPQAIETAMQIADQMATLSEMLRKMRPPLAVPLANPDDKKRASWEPLSTSIYLSQAREAMAIGETSFAVTAWQRILRAYTEDKPEAFNEAVADYAAALKRNSVDHYDADRVRYEAFLNRFAPFGWTQGILLYAVAFLTALVSLAVRGEGAHKAAFWMLIAAVCLHTFALGARMVISGRPPVTNLYSSAVFIGWAVVIMSLLFEATFRLKITNVIAGLGGMLTLMIAHSLSFDGDTIGVMQAVLDTQFWLATHVVLITLGYGATYFAGFFGLLYILLGVFTPQIDRTVSKVLARVMYGIVCFALLFSFFGTVLGGLWADDSWGRFWGWDPKENGALIIVLWNAFILHAKWDRVANERGLAVLCVAGNIVTSWSWFGTNQLGVGLHSYGFTQGVLLTLGGFVGSQLLVIVLGLLPKSVWRSNISGAEIVKA